MVDAFVYCCDSTDCYWNHGQACISAQIELDEDHKCMIYMSKEFGEMVMQLNLEAQHR